MEALKPGRKSGRLNTMPISRLRASSGFREVLPIVFCVMVSEELVNGLVKLGTVMDTGAANSSDRFGARTSRESTARKRKGSYGVCHVLPIFQVRTKPEVE